MANTSNDFEMRTLKTHYADAYNDGLTNSQMHAVSTNALLETVYQDGFNAGRQDYICKVARFKLDEETWSRIADGFNNCLGCPTLKLTTYCHFVSGYVASKLNECTVLHDSTRPAKMARYK